MLSGKLKVLLGLVFGSVILVLTQMPLASAQSVDSTPSGLGSLWTLGSDALAFFDFEKTGIRGRSDKLAPGTQTLGAASEAALAVDAPCLAGQKTWDGGGAGENWSEAENWSCDAVPTLNDTVIFDGTSTKNATLDIGVTVGNLRINSGYSGTISQGASSVVVGGEFNQSSGTFAGGGGEIDFNGNFILSGGMFTASSGNTFSNGGFSHSTGGTFLHNNGTVTFDGVVSEQGVTNSEPFFNVISIKATELVFCLSTFRCRSSRRARSRLTKVPFSEA